MKNLCNYSGILKKNVNFDFFSKKRKLILRYKKQLLLLRPN